MIADSSLATESCLLEDQSGQENADALPAEESLRASIEMDAMASMDSIAASSNVPRVHRSIQCRGATPMARGKHNIDTIVLHTPEGHVSGTLSVLSGTRAGFDWYLPPSGELYKCNDYLRHFSWHAGDLAYNRRSVGIEQWDFAANMANAPDAHYRKLAELCAYLVETLDLAIRHAKNYGEYGFIAHGTVTPHARWDPGKFDYDKLLSLVSDLVKGRPGLKPDVPENGHPNPKIWLPNLERTAAGTFEEKHLDKARVFTLDGKERAVIIPKGVAMRIPKPGEPADKDDPTPVIPDPVNTDPVVTDPVDITPVVPDPADSEKGRYAAVIDAYFSSLHSTLAPYVSVGAVIYEEAKKANLHVTSACALVEQESAGRNVFGADWGARGVDHIPFAHLPVTKERVGKLISYVRSGGVSNGVGLTQLTWRDFIFDAENRGGAHLPKNQCAVGFELLASYYGKYPYLEAIGAYNAGETNRRNVINTYSAQFAAKHDAWRKRLEGVGEAPSEPAPSEPPSSVNGPQSPEDAPPAEGIEAPPEATPPEATPPEATPPEATPPGGTPHGGSPTVGTPHGEAPTETPPPKEEAPVTPPTDTPPTETAPPGAVSPGVPAAPVKEDTKAPQLSKAAKAIVAAAVPVVSALLLWASTGTLDETEFSVGATGLLTAMLVYFVPNTTNG